MSSSTSAEPPPPPVDAGASAATKPRSRRRMAALAAALLTVLVGAPLVAHALDRHWKRERCKDERGVVVESCVRMNALRAKWGAKVYSASEEETLARDFLGDRRDGFFLDVGAGDYREHSNTFFFEERRGWRGIAIDANPALAEGYAKHRPGTKFFGFFVSDHTGPRRAFFVSESWELSAGTEGYVKHAVNPFTGQAIEYHAIEVPTIALNDLLAREHVTKIDYLSMDIEQAEPAALAGFDIRRYRPDLVCIEMQAPVAASIRGYMTANDYVEVTRYADLDGTNAYFAPRASSRLR